MVVIEDDHMIQALAANASGHPLYLATLPRTPWSNANLLNAHSFSNQKSRSAVFDGGVSTNSPWTS